MLRMQATTKSLLCAATSIRHSAGKPLGSFRWLVWAASPTMGEIGGQNTTFEEMQVIPSGGK